MQMTTRLLDLGNSDIFDPLLNLEIDFAEELLNLPSLDDPVVETSSQLVFETGANEITFIGREFDATMDNAQLDQLLITRGDETLLAARFGSRAIEIVTGDQQIRLDGLFPKGFEDVGNFLINFNNFLDLGSLSQSQVSRLATALSPYLLTGATLIDAGETLFDLFVGTNRINLDVLGYDLTLTGSFSENLGTATRLLGDLAAGGANGGFTLADYPGIDISRFSVTDPDGAVLLTTTGPIEDLAPHGLRNLFVAGTDGTDIVDTFELPATPLSLLSIDMRGGNDVLTLDGTERSFQLIQGDPQTSVATLLGGAGVDMLRIEDLLANSVSVNIGAGTIVATGENNGTNYFAAYGGFEQLALDTSRGAFVTGDATDNFVQLDGGFLAFDGRAGIDIVSLRGSGVASTDVTTTLETGGGTRDVTLTIVSGRTTVAEMSLLDVEKVRFMDRDVEIDDLVTIENSIDEGVVSFSGVYLSETINGNALGNVMAGFDGNDLMRGMDGNDTINGGNGTDTLNGGDGDDFIFGGISTDDLRDLIFAGGGDDRVDAGHGNDEIYGGDGDDVIAGGFGVDTILGQDGDDVLTGGAFSDVVFGGDGDDFINGGFGSDRLNGGGGADRFYHIGLQGHGSDFIQDFSHADGDRLLFGGAADIGDFQVNTANTPGAGSADVQEAFIIYRPTEQILWALIDGAAEDSLILQIGGQSFDLLE